MRLSNARDILLNQILMKFVIQYLDCRSLFPGKRLTSTVYTMAALHTLGTRLHAPMFPNLGPTWNSSFLWRWEGCTTGEPHSLLVFFFSIETVTVMKIFSKWGLLTVSYSFQWVMRIQIYLLRGPTCLCFWSQMQQEGSTAPKWPDSFFYQDTNRSHTADATVRGRHLEC